MFVPPVQAHADAVIFSDTHDNHTEVLDNDHQEDHHQEDHHQNDSEENKNTKHHHHCTSLGFSSALISPLATYSNVVRVVQEKTQIHFYQKNFLSNYLDTLIEPPQV
jgi:hypothetical protein